MKKVLIHGWVMLKGIKSGKTYLIEEVNHNQYGKIYWFKTPKTKKIIIGHYAKDVDCWIDTPDKRNNFIEILN